MDLKNISNKYTVRWDSSIKDISATDWETIFGKSNIKSYRFFQATELSNFEEITYHYLSVRDNDNILAIVACFTYYLDLTDLLTDKVSKFIIGKVRKISPNFGKFRMLVIGSYPATCEHFIDIRTDIDKQQKEEIATIINKELEEKRKYENCGLIMVKDVRTKYVNDVNKILSTDFHFFSSFPTTFIPIENTLAYPSALNKKQRRRYRKYQKQFEDLFYWEKIENFENQSDIVFESYLRTLNRAKNKFEVLNKRFFQNINTFFEKESFLLIARNKQNDEVELIEIVLKEEDRLLPLYLGTYKTENNENTLTLYLNALFEPVKRAEKIAGMELVEFGQTSYYPKVLSGALVEDLSYGFYSNHPIMKRVIKHLFKYIFTLEKVPKHAYSQTHLDKIKKIIKKKGMEVINL